MVISLATVIKIVIAIVIVIIIIIVVTIIDCVYHKVIAERFANPELRQGLLAHVGPTAKIVPGSSELYN